MNITEPFVLKDDVLLIPCNELNADLRERISFDEGDFTLSRRHGRSPSQVIDGDTAALLALFREPRTKRLSCTCADFVFRGNAEPGYECKHVSAVLKYIGRRYLAEEYDPLRQRARAA